MAQRRHPGALQRRSGKLWVRFRMPDGSRPRFEVPEDLDERARGEFIRRLHAAEVKRVENHLEASQGLTVRAFGERWTSGELYREHGEVRGLRPKKSAWADAGRLAQHVYPIIGDKLVSEVTELDIEHVLAEAPKRYLATTERTLSRATHRHVYQVLRRLFDLAVRPGRLRKENPVSDELKPGKGKPKLYNFLYPDELLMLLGCTSIPIARRVLYVLASYTGLRKSSLYPLRWSGVDFRHGTITSLHSKTELPQLFDVAPMSLSLLQSWHERKQTPDERDRRRFAAVCPELEMPPDLIVAGVDIRPKQEAKVLRADLKRAGVDRDQLFGGHPKIEPMRFHDLRATFITWARRQGRGWGWVTDRSGHVVPEQVERYNRMARTLADLRINPFPDVSAAIPDLGPPAGEVLRVDFGGNTPCPTCGRGGHSE